MWRNGGFGVTGYPRYRMHKMLFRQMNFWVTVGAKLVPHFFTSNWTCNVINCKTEHVFCMSQILPGENVTLGVSVLKSRGIFTEAKWYWIGLGALLGYTLLFNLLYTVALSVLSRKYIWKTFFRTPKYLINICELKDNNCGYLNFFRSIHWLSCINVWGRIER